jgi:hypothetical protein
MFLPFKLPHAGLQALRQRWFYSRVVFYYKVAHQFDLFNKKCVPAGGAAGRLGGHDGPATPRRKRGRKRPVAARCLPSS